jgi:hypothetical protein
MADGLLATVELAPVPPPPHPAMATAIKLAAANLIQWEDGRLVLDSSKYFTLASLGITVKKPTSVANTRRTLLKQWLPGASPLIALQTFTQRDSPRKTTF